MKIYVGDSVVYSFPNPVTPEEDRFIGKVEEVSESYIFIKNDKNIRLRVSSKNFYLISSVKVIQKFSD